MITINFNGNKYKIRNNMNEILIKEFEHISSIMSSDKLHFDKWIEVFEYLGLPSEVIDNFDTFDFMRIIEKFNLDINIEGDILKEIEVDGKVYKSYDNEFKMTVREFALIEKYIKDNENRYIGDIMAVLYKVGDDKNINLDKSHIHHKAELFRKNLTIDKAIPVIAYISKKLVKDFNIINENT